MNASYINQQIDKYNDLQDTHADDFFPELFQQFGGSIDDFIKIVSSHPEQKDYMDEVYSALKDAGVITAQQALDMTGNYNLYGDDAENENTDEYDAEDFKYDAGDEYLDEITKRQWQHRAGIIK